jgi:hypothetical protein
MLYPYHVEGCTARDLASRSRGYDPIGLGHREGPSLSKWHNEKKNIKENSDRCCSPVRYAAELFCI